MLGLAEGRGQEDIIPEKSWEDVQCKKGKEAPGFYPLRTTGQFSENKKRKMSGLSGLGKSSQRKIVEKEKSRSTDATEGEKSRCRFFRKKDNADLGVRPRLARSGTCGTAREEQEKKRRV